MNETRNYDYVAAEAGQSCRICYRPFAEGETIKVYEGYKRACVSISACVGKLHTLPAMVGQGVRP